MQPIDTVNPTILLAIELSASTWLVAARVPGLEKPHLHRIDGGDTAAHDRGPDAPGAEPGGNDERIRRRRRLGRRGRLDRLFLPLRLLGDENGRSEETGDGERKHARYHANFRGRGGRGKR